MSTLKADTIVAIDGTSPVTLTKQSAAKAWACFVQSTSHTLNDSFNISSLTDSGAGWSATAYTNSFNNDDYSSTGMAGKSGTRVRMDTLGASAKLSTGQQLYVTSPVPVATDGDDCNVTCHGDLA
jgi:hypothetical protein